MAVSTEHKSYNIFIGAQNTNLTTFSLETNF